MSGRKVRYKDGVFTDIRDIEDICQELKALVEDLQDEKQYHFHQQQNSNY